jgi:hypothetical protein
MDLTCWNLLKSFPRSFPRPPESIPATSSRRVDLRSLPHPPSSFETAGEDVERARANPGGIKTEIDSVDELRRKSLIHAAGEIAAVHRKQGASDEARGI